MHTAQTIQLISAELQPRAALLYCIILLAPSQPDAVRVPIKRAIIISNKVYYNLYHDIANGRPIWSIKYCPWPVTRIYIYMIYPYGIRNRMNIINRMDNANIQCVPTLE